MAYCVNGYLKPGLVEIAVAVGKMMLPVDPNFEKVNDAHTKKQTLNIHDIQIEDPFTIKRKNDFIDSPPFGCNATLRRLDAMRLSAALMQCSNTLLKEIRYSFIQKLHQINSSFSLFNDQDMFLYIISMKDRSITKLVAKFCYDILAGFDHLQ